MKGTTEATTRYEAFIECRKWVSTGSIAENELKIKIDELKWFLEKAR